MRWRSCEKSTSRSRKLRTRLQQRQRQRGLVTQAQNVDWKLHNTLIDFLGNALIASACRVNLLKLRIFRQEQTRLDETLVIPTMREHLAVLEALETPDPRKAADAMAEHILRAQDRALGLQSAKTPAKRK